MAVISPSRLVNARAAILVETPLQLLCAYEAEQHEHRKTDIYVRITRRGRNDSQLISIAEALFPGFQTVNAPVDSFWRKSWALLKIVSRSHIHRYQKFYLGSYFSGFQRAVEKFCRPTKIVFLDDGMATLSAQRKMSQGTVKDIPALFTFFDVEPLPGQTVVRHEFERLKRRAACQKPACELDGASVFVGQPLIERGYVTENLYINAIRRAKCEAGNRLLYYIPHRHENGRAKSLIRDIAGCRILDMDGCIEWFFLQNQCKPKWIFGFNSTAMITMAKLFPRIRCVVFETEFQGYETPEHLDDINTYMRRDDRIRVIDWNESTQGCNTDSKEKRTGLQF